MDSLTARARQRKEPATNRRKQIRYPLRAPIAYQWRNGQGQEQRGRGWTQNVSEQGALVSSDKCPAAGDLVNLTLRVPPLRTAVPAPTMRMGMSAKVVRVLKDMRDGKDLGFAVHAHRAFAAEQRHPRSPQLSHDCGSAIGLKRN
jgi:hypothetical protein